MLSIDDGTLNALAVELIDNCNGMLHCLMLRAKFTLNMPSIGGSLMKKGKVKVGCKFGSEHFAVECSIDIPENDVDRKALRWTPEFQNKMEERGWRIWCQEQSGARDFIQQSTVKQREDAGFPKLVQSIIDKADPTAPPARTGRPAKPAEVTVTPEMQAAAKKGDMSKFTELLAAQGIKVNINK